MSSDIPQVVTAIVDIEEVRSFRCSPSRGLQATHTEPFQRIEADIRLSKRGQDLDPRIVPSGEIEVRIHSPQEEIALSPAIWLWDYL